MKKFRDLIIESAAGRLKDYATIKSNMRGADFWITRRGTPDKIGEPTKTFHKEAFGVKVTALDVLEPDFLYYAMMNIHMQGHYKNLGTGTTKLVAIKLSNLENIRIGQM